jgi:multidrug efflux pump subunit AcrB
LKIQKFIEWNENIHVEENKERVEALLKAVEKEVIEHSALVAQQQFFLNREREQTSSEAEAYFKTPHVNDISRLKEHVANFIETHYPLAAISFAPPKTIFEKIFIVGEADLIAEYYAKNKAQEPDISEIKALELRLTKQAGIKPTGISFQKQLNLRVDMDKLLLYNVAYNEIYNTLKTGFRENQVADMRSFQQNIPVYIGGEDQSIHSILEHTLIHTQVDEKGERNRLPLSFFVSVTSAEDLKTIIAGRNGEYIPFSFFGVNDVDAVVARVRSDTQNNSSWDVDFSGSFFSNKKMLQEPMVILFISILLNVFYIGRSV